jgi:hypothetical protein
LEKKGRSAFGAPSSQAAPGWSSSHQRGVNNAERRMK